ncbi:hypothetical protein TRIP_B170030 [uncultured Desulfatiglans sp.]|nr:hypothetical protein TRIP_B170030 [uncultured Desulfatiglans sp.]
MISADSESPFGGKFHPFLKRKVFPRVFTRFLPSRRAVPEPVDRGDRIEGSRQRVRFSPGHETALSWSAQRAGSGRATVRCSFRVGRADRCRGQVAGFSGIEMSPDYGASSGVLWAVSIASNRLSNEGEAAYAGTSARGWRDAGRLCRRSCHGPDGRRAHDLRPGGCGLRQRPDPGLCRRGAAAAA